MKSVHDELSDRIRAEPAALRRSGPRQDLGMLLFARHEELDALWKAAAALLDAGDAEKERELAAAVEALRPLFGERP